MTTQHKNAESSWRNFTLAEQMGNIGSEVYRVKRWQGKDEEQFWRAVERAQELFELTLRDSRWSSAQKREIILALESFADALSGGGEYGSFLDALENYFNQFAYIARRGV